MVMHSNPNENLPVIIEENDLKNKSTTESSLKTHDYRESREVDFSIPWKINSKSIRPK